MPFPAPARWRGPSRKIHAIQKRPQVHPTRAERKIGDVGKPDLKRQPRSMQLQQQGEHAMYFKEPRSERHPFRFALALVAALFVNGAIGAAMIHSGIDDRLAHDASAAAKATVVADLGTLPVVHVTACRTAV